MTELNELDDTVSLSYSDDCTDALLLERKRLRTELALLRAVANAARALQGAVAAYVQYPDDDDYQKQERDWMMKALSQCALTLAKLDAYDADMAS